MFSVAQSRPTHSTYVDTLMCHVDRTLFGHVYARSVRCYVQPMRAPAGQHIASTAFGTYRITRCSATVLPQFFFICAVCWSGQQRSLRYIPCSTGSFNCIRQHCYQELTVLVSGGEKRPCSSTFLPSLCHVFDWMSVQSSCTLTVECVCRIGNERLFAPLPPSPPPIPIHP